MDPEALMRVAIEKCRQGLALGQSPFGCAIATGGEVIACQHNTVTLTTDITAHAEVNALRAACRRQRTIHLPEAIVATTCEPCPMCMTALHWARVKTIYYGATIDDAKRAGFNELQLPAKDLARAGGGKVELVDGVLADDCRSLFATWAAAPDRQAY